MGEHGDRDGAEILRNEVVASGKDRMRMPACTRPSEARGLAPSATFGCVRVYVVSATA